MTLSARLSRNVAILFALTAAGAQGRKLDTLRGNLPPLVRKGPSPWIVTGNLHVPAGQKTVIEPGVVFLFGAFAALHVRGELIARGTVRQPIVFTSENDGGLNPRARLAPAPYDWNGITVHEECARAVFHRCRIEYSLYGIHALASVSVSSCTFRQNGRSNLTIAGAATADRILGIDISPRVKLGAPPTTDGEGALTTPRLFVRYGGMAVFVAGGIAGLAYGAEYRQAFARLKTQSLAPDPDALARRQMLEREMDAAGARAATSLVSALAGAVALGLSWTF